MSDSKINNDTTNDVMAFTFGDPTPVLEGREILEYVESYWSGRWYEPPITPSEKLSNS